MSANSFAQTNSEGNKAFQAIDSEIKTFQQKNTTIDNKIRDIDEQLKTKSNEITNLIDQIKKSNKTIQRQTSNTSSNTQTTSDSVLLQRELNAAFQHKNDYNREKIRLTQEKAENEQKINNLLARKNCLSMEQIEPLDLSMKSKK